MDAKINDYVQETLNNIGSVDKKNANISNKLKSPYSVSSIKFWKNSLTSKLSSCFMLMSLVTVSLVGYAVFSQAKESLKQSAFNRLNVAATLKEQELERWFEDQRHNFIFISKLPEVQSQSQILLKSFTANSQSQSNPKSLIQYLTNATVNNSNLQEIFILTNTGKIVFSTNSSRQGKYENIGNFSQVDRTEVFVPNFYPNSLTAKPTLTFMVPIVDSKGQRLGMIAAHINLQRIDKIIRERNGLGKSGETYLIGRLADQSAFISKENYENQSINSEVHSQGIDIVTQGIDGYGIYQNYQKRTVIGVYHWLDNRNLAVIAEMHAEEAFEPAQQLAWTILLVGLGSAGILATGVYLLVHKITQPILTIAKKATQVAEGDLSQTVPVLTEDEVGVLARAFNQMTGQLRISRTQLEAESQTLEQKAHQLQRTLTELNHTQAQLIQNEKMSSLGQLVAGVAHEINNPINFIYGNITPATQYTQDLLNLVHLYQEFYPNPVNQITEYSQEIDLEFTSKDLPKILSSMKVGAERIREIVLSLRNFSRLDEAEMKQVDLHEGINSTLLILQNRLKAKPENSGIQVIKDYGNLPQVECYAGQLNQVFMNIISNAIDALDIYNSQRSIAEIKQNPSQIKIYTELSKSNTVKVIIADNGSGIPAEVQKRIFDPFFTTKPVGKGTGLGLSISYQIVVEKHCGSLKCISELGKGTEFCLEIPVKQTVCNITASHPN